MSKLFCNRLSLRCIAFQYVWSTMYVNILISEQLCYLVHYILQPHWNAIQFKLSSYYITINLENDVCYIESQILTFTVNPSYDFSWLFLHFFLFFPLFQWTLMCYMFEGESSKTFIKARKFLNQNLQTSSRLLQQLTDLIIDYLVLQVRAGAQVNSNTDFRVVYFLSVSKYWDVNVYDSVHAQT